MRVRARKKIPQLAGSATAWAAHQVRSSSSLRRRFRLGPVTKTAVWSSAVVFLQKSLAEPLGLGQVGKLIAIQYFGPKATEE